MKELRWLKPSRRFIGLMGLLFTAIFSLETLAIIGFGLPSFMVNLVYLMAGVFVVALVVDLILVKRIPSPKIRRTVPGYLSLMQWNEVTLTLDNQSSHALSLTLFDHVPAGIAYRALPKEIELGEFTHKIGYGIHPSSRGYYEWECCEVMIESPLKLWGDRRQIALPSKTRVYPDFTKLYGGGLETIEEWIHQLGIRVQQRRGDGQSFHQLREFMQGDTLKQVDWKASAKHRKPITKEMQEERDQHIIFVLDCGLKMRIKEYDLTHFDHVLNASLLLSYVALKQEDAVGLTTFATPNGAHLPPKKGVGQLNALLNAVYTLECTREVPDFDALIKRLLTDVKRRSLIIFLTNLRNHEDEATLEAFKLLTKKHEVLIASLREEVTDTLMKTDVHDLDSALTYCGTVKHLSDRRALYDNLYKRRLPIIEALPSEFAPALINHYLA
ncbi:MAG: DUF58 domain-containing protein, partial [Xanthomonadaceae bacterium]|nr:DUF58 domain-containing protein [Xanthomonadaceae bacterium]